VRFIGRKGCLLGGLALLLLAVPASAVVVQTGNLRIGVLAQVQPFKLPRREPAPIAVFLSGHVGTVDGETPPQLRRMTVKVNRHGLLQSLGLPSCQLSQIQPGSTTHALEQCSDALIGSGRFWASVVFPDQRPYPTRGRLLVFNGRKEGRPVMFAHIFTSQPFNSSFVISFAIRKISGGPYGTELSASLPQALGNWGFVDRIKLTLRRKYRYKGRQRSYFNAACPALPGASVAAYPLALASFYFAHHRRISGTVVKSCAVAR
jgi:xanthosine utilization system XapX-like protein